MSGLRSRMWMNIPLPWHDSLTYSDIEVAFKKRREIVIGELVITGIPGAFNAQGNTLSASIPESYHGAVKQLMDDIEERLEASSIFKGAALTSNYEFFDPAMLEVGTLIYGKEVLADLEDHVWTLLQDLEGCREAGIREQRKVLLSGPFGSGKTMALLKTMAIAVKNGWTSIYIEPAIKPSTIIDSVLKHSTKYQPVLITIENFDQEQNEGQEFQFRQLLEALDGAMSKIGTLLFVMTTNYPNKLKAETLRTGRIDKVIDFSRFGPEDATRLLQVLIPESYLAEDISWSAVSDACKGYMPAFINGVAENAMLPAVRNRKGGAPQVTQEMLIRAAHGLAIQHKRCTKVKTGFTVDDENEY